MSSDLFQKLFCDLNFWFDNIVALFYDIFFYSLWYRTCGIELWDCVSNSNIEIIQRYQTKLLRIITNAPRYVTNHILHSDLHIPYVREVFQERIAIHPTAIASHPNPHHGHTSSLADQQTSKTTMDTRRDTLRRRRWTHP
jgi:hypothetical protein